MQPKPSVLESAVTPRSGSRGHLPSLDGLRGLAILAVFFHHYGAGGADSSSSVVRFIATVCGLGWSGVDLFFVLSGFLITGILYDTQQDRRYYRNFYARRALRIFPIYYLFIAIALLILPISAWHAGDALFLVYLGYPAALIWPSLVNLPIRITHLWSLSVEEQFYFLWPWSIRKLSTPSRILALCGTAVLVSLVLRIAIPEWAYAFLPCRMDDLALGGAVAVLFRAGWHNECRRLAPWLLGVSTLAITLICFARQTTSHTDRIICTAGFSVIGIGYASLLVLALGPLSSFFSNRVLRIFGRYSYGMYLYHFPLTAVFERGKVFFVRMPLGSALYVASCLAANLMIAALSFHLLERRMLTYKSRFEYEGRSPDSELGSLSTEKSGLEQKTGVDQVPAEVALVSE